MWRRRRAISKVQPRRLQLLDAIARAIDANNEAMRIALELEAEEDEPTTTAPPPPNIERDPNKTSPRLPFKTDTPPPRRDSKLIKRQTQYAFAAFTGERALAHVKKAYDEATSDEDRKRVVVMMKKLADQGLFRLEDIAEYTK